MTFGYSHPEVILKVYKLILNAATRITSSATISSRLMASIYQFMNKERNTMPRILPVNPAQTDTRTASTLKAVRAKLGILPNLFTTLAQAPAALNGYLQLSESLSHGRLSARQREIIAIAIAQENACVYCLSAHAAIGQGVGLSDEDIERAKYGRAADPKDEAVTELALRIVRSRADLTDGVLAAARLAGLDDGLIIEVIAQVALNVLTNYVNRIAGTDVDFPLMELSPAA